MDEAAARKGVEAAIEIFEGLESRLELARALVVRAGVGEKRDEDLQRARELFEGCGVTGDPARRQLRTAPDRAVLRLVREVRDGEW